MADKTVPVLAADGTPGTLPAQQVPQLVESGGRVMSPAEVKATEDGIAFDRKYDPAEHPLRAIGSFYGAGNLGWLRGVTGGLSDVAIAKIGGPEAAKQVDEWRRLHPALSTSEEISGFAGAAATGRAGLAGAVGRFAPGLAAAATPTTALGRIAAGAAAGAGEMGIYEGGRAAGDAALANEEITGEKIVAGMKHGAIVGAIAGGGFGALGEIGGAARAAVRKPAAEAASEVATSELAPAAARGEETLAERFGGALQKEADVRTVKALGGSAGDIRALERNVPGGFQRVAQDIRGDVEATTGKSIGRHSRESLHEYAEARTEELGKKLDTMTKRLDDAKVGIAPSADSFVAEARQKLVDPLVTVTPAGERIVAPGAKPVVDAVEKFLGEVEESAAAKAPTFSEWRSWRINLQRLAKFEKASSSPAEGALQKLRGMMESHFEDAAEEAASQMGESFKAEYRATKSLYQSVLKASELTERGVARDLANNSFGLTSRMAGIAGAAVGGGPAGIASALGAKVLQTHGDVLAADLLDRAAGLLGARRIAARAEAQMARGVKDLVGKAANDNADVRYGELLAPPARGAIAPLGVKLSGDRRKDYGRIVDKLTAAAGNPAMTTERMASALGELPNHAPKAAQSVIDTTLRGMQFLSSKLPPSRQDPHTLQPQLQPRTRASDAEISRFMRYAHAVDDPLVVLREAKTGTLTRDHVEAVKAVYPKLYDEMRTEVMRSLVNTKRELPYTRRIQLGILLDLPTDATLAPDFMRAIQATFSRDEKAGAEPPSPNLSRNLHVASSEQTAMQSAASRAA